MIGKILLTLAVIAVAYLMLRRGSESKLDTAKSAPVKIAAGGQEKYPVPTLHDDRELHPICFYFSWWWWVLPCITTDGRMTTN